MKNITLAVTDDAGWEAVRQCEPPASVCRTAGAAGPPVPLPLNKETHSSAVKP
jgi:hypothetical protein